LVKPVAAEKIGKLIEAPRRSAKINIPHRPKMPLRIMVCHRPALEE